MLFLENQANFTVKQEKHNSIKLLAQAKLDIIRDAYQDKSKTKKISFVEFQKKLLPWYLVAMVFNA